MAACFRVDTHKTHPDVPEHVAEVVLCRPKKLNTMTAAFFDECTQVFTSLDNNPDIYAIILRAEGSLFTAGLDLKDAASVLSSAPGVQSTVQLYHTIHRWQASFTALAACKKPIIAAIHGKCIGGGIDMITAADVRLASQDAVFTIAETKLAIVADLGTLQRISRIVGSGIAREMAFTSNPINANRALQVGLINHISPSKDQLITQARKMAASMASHSPLVVQGVKKVLNYAETHPNTADSLDMVALWNTAFLRSDDLMEAISSFLSKSSPSYTNKL